MATGPRELLSSSALDSETFRVYCYKIVPCAKKFGHDWSECPFAHDGEKATRRCPALYRYSSIVCPEIRQSRACPRGDVCPYSHSIFEYWMHPARFRAQLCSFGTECNRRICFFAHTQEQLRTPSEPVVADALASRAPYLQGRVSPESRFALYPEQVPALVPMPAGMLVQQQQQQQLLPQADLGGGMPLQQVVYVPAGGPAGMAPGAGGGGGAAVGAGGGHQWGGGGGGGMGYYMAAGGGGGGGLGGGGPGGGPGGGYSAPMMVGPGMQVVNPGGYGGPQQPMQLMAAVGPDGSMSMQQYPLGPGGGLVAYAPVFPAGAGGGPGGMAASPWPGAAPHQAGGAPGGAPGPAAGQQQALQLMQVPGDGSEGGPGQGMGRGGQDGAFILTPTGQLASSRGLAAVEPQYAMAMGPGAGLQRGAGVVSRPLGAGAGAGIVQQAAPAGGAPGDATPGVDDIAQQMAGWRMQ